MGLALLAVEDAVEKPTLLARVERLLESEVMVALQPWYLAELAIHLVDSGPAAAREALQRALRLADEVGLTEGSEARSRLRVATALLSAGI